MVFQTFRRRGYFLPWANLDRGRPADEKYGLKNTGGEVRTEAGIERRGVVEGLEESLESWMQDKANTK